MAAGAKTTQLDHWQRVGASYAAEWAPPARNRLGERELDVIARIGLAVGVGRLVGHLAPGGAIVFSESSGSPNAVARPSVVDGPTPTLARGRIVTGATLRRLLGGSRLAREIFVVASR